MSQIRACAAFTAIGLGAVFFLYPLVMLREVCKMSPGVHLSFSYSQDSVVCLLCSISIAMASCWKAATPERPFVPVCELSDLQVLMVLFPTQLAADTPPRLLCSGPTEAISSC